MYDPGLKFSRAAGFIVGLGLALILVSVVGPARADPIASNKLKELFSGTDVHFTMEERKTQGWSSAQYKFGADGGLSGYLFSSAYIAQRNPFEGLDNGQWRVGQDKLCLQWERWNDAKEHCYDVTGDGEDFRAAGGEGMFAGKITLIR